MKRPRSSLGPHWQIECLATLAAEEVGPALFLVVCRTYLDRDAVTEFLTPFESEGYHYQSKATHHHPKQSTPLAFLGCRPPDAQ
jgi:hypothetical protein